MDRIWTIELGLHEGERIRLQGWLHHIRRLSRVSFLILRDARGLAQIVVEDPGLAARLAGYYRESVIAVEGLVVAAPQVPGGFEVREPAVELISAAEAPPPFDLFRPNLGAHLPTILDHAPLCLRHPCRRAVTEVAAAAVAGFRRSLRALDFIEIRTPKIVAAATESGANVFALDYFGRPAYLAQSPQFYKQIMVGVHERVFETGPVFRAEPHDTPRHLNEYYSLDAEMGFIEDHRAVMRVVTRVIAGMLEAVGREGTAAMDLLGVTLPEVPREMPVIHFREALALIEAGTKRDLSGEEDLDPAGERYLGEWARREHGTDFLFVTGFPTRKRPFYTHPDPEQPGYSRGFDLLFRGRELVTGGQRLHRYRDYLAALKDRGLPVEPFQSYLEAFKYGIPPHGGFAVGLERFVMQLAGLGNIREAALFPRDRSRVDP